MAERVCPSCGSSRLEKLVLLSRRISWGAFIRDQENCPVREDCINANSARCNLCHREYVVVRHFLSRASNQLFSNVSKAENWCQFKDKEYYRKIVPFIEVKWLFIEADKGQGA